MEIEISWESLNQLLTKEFESYKTLRRKRFDGAGVEALLGILGHFSFYRPIACVISLVTWENYFIIILVGIAVPYSLFPTYWIGKWLDLGSRFRRRYSQYVKRSRSYVTLQLLKEKFAPIESNVLKQLDDYLDFGLRKLILIVRSHPPDTTEYKRHISIFRSNHVFLNEASRAL